MMEDKGEEKLFSTSPDPIYPDLNYRLHVETVSTTVEASREN